MGLKGQEAVVIPGMEIGQNIAEPPLPFPQRHLEAVFTVLHVKVNCGVPG